MNRLINSKYKIKLIIILIIVIKMKIIVKKIYKNNNKSFENIYKFIFILSNFNNIIVLIVI